MPLSGASAGTTVTRGPVAHGAADRAWRISPGVAAVEVGLFLAHVVDVSGRGYEKLLKLLCEILVSGEGN